MSFLTTVYYAINLLFDHPDVFIDCKVPNEIELDSDTKEFSPCLLTNLVSVNPTFST